MTDPAPWPDRVTAGRDYLVNRGHLDPIVGVSTPTGRFSAGDATARCEIGSVTKVFTALLLAELGRTGEVSFDTKVADLVPAGTEKVDQRPEHQHVSRRSHVDPDSHRP